MAKQDQPSRPIVLFQTVGTGGPKNPVWEALAFTIRNVSPIAIVHFCSHQTAEETLPKVQELLGDWPAPQQTYIADDPENLEDLTLEYGKRMADARKRYPDAQIHVDFTSGTKAMSAAVVAAGIAQNAAKLHYASGPRDESGRVIKTEWLVSLPADQLIARRRLDEAGLLFNRGQFEAARRIAEEHRDSLTDPILVARADSLIFLARACDAWQRFDWRAASAILRDLKKHNIEDSIKEAEWDVDHIKQMRNFLAAAAKGNSEDQTNARLVDLLANAERCIRAARYDDAVARLYRLVEYITQTRLAAHGIDNSSKADPQSVRKIAPEWSSAKGNALAGNTLRLGLRDQILILDEAGDGLGRDLARQYFGDDAARRHPKGPLGNALNARNDSLLAHGTTPIKEEVAGQLFNLVQNALAEHLSSEKLDELLNAARFPQCPWAPEEPLPNLDLDSSIPARA